MRKISHPDFSAIGRFACGGVEVIHKLALQVDATHAAMLWKVLTE